VRLDCWKKVKIKYKWFILTKISIIKEELAIKLADEKNRDNKPVKNIWPYLADHTLNGPWEGPESPE